MPNRYIKESICTSKNLNMLSAEAERLFYRLLVKCDDFGRYFADPNIIKGNCFPRKSELKTKEIEKWLNELAKSELIILYKNKDDIYLQFITFSEHNRKRANTSKFPNPADSCQQMTTDENKSGQAQTNAPLYVNEYDNEYVDTSADKQKHGEHVLLTPKEYKKLTEDYGENAVRDYIERLNGYREQFGPRKFSQYKSHNATIRNWMRKDGVKKREPPALSSTHMDGPDEQTQRYLQLEAERKQKHGQDTS